MMTQIQPQHLKLFQGTIYDLVFSSSSAKSNFLNINDNHS
ncbi:uncharacterized protein METZ01_LOCUS97068 [marine metagenome]|uniref:Uncharacterized protein n=1 Tax=marine metagenome TaxID=408172 RepID=A0A381VVA9_9ZZZZ